MSTSVVCAVPTYRRNDMLAELLDALERQDLNGADARVEVAVIDNDAGEGARELVASRKATSRFPLHYVPIPEAGLSNVRNAAISFAAERCDLIAMIDDDEVPDPQWLSELLRVERETGADVVVGPVIPVVPHGAPRWIEDLRGSETPMALDGARQKEGWSCNALVRTETIARYGLVFDAALNFTGGEDQLFFRQIVAHGGTIVFAAAAIVRETIPPGRLSIGFNLMRSFRRGNSLSVCDRRLDGSPLNLGVRASKGIGLIAIGALTIVPLAVLRGKASAVRSSCEIARGVGMLAGLFGMLYQAYARKEQRLAEHA